AVVLGTGPVPPGASVPVRRVAEPPGPATFATDPEALVPRDRQSLPVRAWPGPGRRAAGDPTRRVGESIGRDRAVWGGASPPGRECCSRAPRPGSAGPDTRQLRPDRRERSSTLAVVPGPAGDLTASVA